MAISQDSLARDGALFERFYVCPVCSPTRAEFLTGRYHPRGGVRGVTTGGERLNLDEKTLGDAFKASGYATGVQVWMNPASSGGAGGGGSPIVPEPATFLLPLLIGANYLRRRRRRA